MICVFKNLKCDSALEMNLLDTEQLYHPMPLLPFYSADPPISEGNKALPPKFPPTPIQTSAPFILEGQVQILRPTCMQGE